MRCQFRIGLENDVCVCMCVCVTVCVSVCCVLASLSSVICYCHDVVFGASTGN